jgi:hypothetical protein
MDFFLEKKRQQMDEMYQTTQVQFPSYDNLMIKKQEKFRFLSYEETNIQIKRIDGLGMTATLKLE